MTHPTPTATEVQHDSDCAQHNEPAYPNDPCDCSASTHPTPTAPLDGDKVIRDGKVAVLVSHGFGAGWSTWNSGTTALLFDPALVAATEAGDQAAIVARANEIDPNGFYGGADGLTVHWIDQGAQFRIDEYDGAESLTLAEDEQWTTA